MQKLTKVLNLIKKDLLQGENLDTYVAILLGITFTILGIIGKVSDSLLNNLMLLTITLLVISSLKNRHILTNLNTQIESSSQKDFSNALKDRSEYEPLENRLSNAHEVIIIGTHLLGFVNYNKDSIRKFAKQSCNFKFVLADPELNLPDSAFRGDVERTILSLKQISKDFPRQISIRFAQKELPCAIFARDISTSNGLIQIQPHPIYEETDLRAHYDLYASTNSKWYKHYQDQIELLWASSKEFHL